jgi:MRG-binding protein
MAPRKKTRGPSRAASTPSGEVVEQATEEVSAPVKNDVVDTSPIPDAWTDEQETSLFKGVIRWKPVGSFSELQSYLDTSI